MDLHGQIMNIRCLVGNDASAMLGTDAYLAYKNGHRDARHAAAELANEHTALFEEFRAEVQRCFDLAQRMDSLEPGIPGAFTGTPSERIARQLAVMRDEFVSG